MLTKYLALVASLLVNIHCSSTVIYHMAWDKVWEWAPFCFCLQRHSTHYRFVINIRSRSKFPSWLQGNKPTWRVTWKMWVSVEKCLTKQSNAPALGVPPPHPFACVQWASLAQEGHLWAIWMHLWDVEGAGKGSHHDRISKRHARSLNGRVSSVLHTNNKELAWGLQKTLLLCKIRWASTHTVTNNIEFFLPTYHLSKSAFNVPSLNVPFTIVHM